MDAHDTNQPLNQGELEEEKKTVEVSEAITETPSEETTAEVQPEAAPKPATKEDVLNRLKELAQDAENANKQEIDNLKQSFYKLHNAELEAAKVQFTDNGGNIEDFVAEEDPTEEEFKRLMLKLFNLFFDPNKICSGIYFYCLIINRCRSRDNDVSFRRLDLKMHILDILFMDINRYARNHNCHILVFLLFFDDFK